ncbi:hypothetical protein LC612_34080 [Nostoc sp. CHAB 5834]|nr:hypothetical protein [Nostoc sp. CHAB 5834]
MLFLLIFPVLVAGFFACHIHPVHSFRLHRYEGQYLYLKSAELGLKCFFFAGLASLAMHHWLPDNISVCERIFSWQLLSWLIEQMKMAGATDLGEASKMAWFVQLSFLTFIAAFALKLWAHLRLSLRFRSWNTRLHVIGEILEDSPLDYLLYSLSLDENKNVMLMMEDRKVYVGRVVNLGEPSATGGMDQDVVLIPLMSGYRDKDTLEVTFTTMYSEVEADILISLRQDNILSATEFDFDAYHKWNPNRAKAGTENQTILPA